VDPLYYGCVNQGIGSSGRRHAQGLFVVTLCYLHIMCLTIPSSPVFIADMTMLGKISRSDPEGNMLVPEGYEPTTTDVRFMGSMGYVCFASEPVTFVQSSFKRCSYLAGMCTDGIYLL
jgi:hypothetical protein